MIFPRSCVTVLKRTLFLFACLFPAVLFSCASSPAQQIVIQEVVEQKTLPPQTISMLFAGDIMAHTDNFKSGNFERIWSDVKPLVSSADLSFANIEAPVNDNMEWNTYPQFNMHSEYVLAAMDAGFNVFSLANNHTNDWFLEGINATRTWFSKQKNIWYAGLRSENNGSITYSVIEKNGWKILFVAFTEILNRADYSSWIDYFPSSKHENLINQLTQLSNTQEHDLFVISIHTDEAEYKKEITNSHKSFYRELAEKCGADIIWANHPHVFKDFEFIEVNGSAEKPSKKAFVMYANGNTISGQRTAPSLQKNHVERDDTGDGLMIKVSAEKKDGHITFTSVEPHFITTFIQTDGQFVVRLADDDFIHSLNRAGLPVWASYIEKRRSIFNSLKGN